jgi:hypothetical protein
MLVTDRGPLRFIVLAATGQDVSQCAACEACYVDGATEAEFDLALWEAFAAVREDDETALTSQTIWSLADARPEDVGCIKRLHLVTVARVLRREAYLRGLTPVREINIRRKVLSE